MQEIEQIYTQYRQDVYRYLCSLTRDAALAEDLLSETFLRALTGLSGFRKGACVRTWLCCKRAARPPERCFGCGRRDIRSRRSHRGAASAKARPARWIFARATGCGSNCRRRGQSYENTNRARDTL